MRSQAQITHRQHQVPKWHLRNFADANGDLWCYRRALPPRPKRPKGVCWERDFYEYDVNGHRTNNEYERWFEGIENDAATRVDALLNRRRFGQWDATCWAVYVSSLFLRSSKCRDQLWSAMTPKVRHVTQSTNFIRDLQHTLLKQGFVVPIDELVNLVDSSRQSMESSPSYYHVVGLRETSYSLAEALMTKTWYTLESPRGMSFLLGDCPVITVEFVGNAALEGAGFKNESTAIILPITSEHLFVASPPRIQWKAALDAQDLASINRLSVRFAHRVVVGNANARETEALVNNEMSHFVFGRDGFVPVHRN